MGPITQQDLTQAVPAFRDAEEMLFGRGVGVRTFQEYFDAIQNPQKLSPAFRARLAAIEATSGSQGRLNEIFDFITRENLDLNIFTREVSDELYGTYRGSILPVNTLLENFGFPGLSFPSDNAYRHLSRYSLDLLEPIKQGHGINPGMLSILRTNFNIKEFASTPEDLSIGRTRLRNPASLQNLFRRTQRLKVIGEDQVVNYLGFDPVADEGKIKTILTWDTETTGLTADARIRNVALVKRQVRVNADGTTTMMGGPEIVMSKHFRSDMMDIAHVYRDGKPVPLSIGTILSEMGPDAEVSNAYRRAIASFEDGGKLAVEDFRDLLRAFMGGDARIGKVDVLEGHNSLAFDIDKLGDTIKSLPAYNDPNNEAAKELKQLWTQFTQKRTGPLEGRDLYFAQDTLDSTKIAMELDRAAIRKTIEEVIGEDPSIFGTEDIAIRRSLQSQVAEYYSRSIVYRSRAIWNKKRRVFRKSVYKHKLFRSFRRPKFKS